MEEIINNLQVGTELLTNNRGTVYLIEEGTNTYISWRRNHQTNRYRLYRNVILKQQH